MVRTVSSAWKQDRLLCHEHSLGESLPEQTVAGLLVSFNCPLQESLKGIQWPESESKREFTEPES